MTGEPGATGPPAEGERTLDAAGVSAALIAWYEGRVRDVPWRGQEDPYRVLVAEVMAQQTRIETVRARYPDFVRRFPDVESLAAAERDEVLKAWEGLGYYARARNLHRAARRLVEEHGGSVPSSRRALESLPGVGPYTAGAVASLAFGRAEPAVDGNARRVLARLFDLEPATASRLERCARSLLETRAGPPASLNQALMDLGSEVCLPISPRCPDCPLRRACLARARGTVGRRPAPRRRGDLPLRHVAVGVVGRDGRVLIQRRPEDGLLGGLWEFPGGKVEPGEEPARAVRRELREELGIDVTVGGLIVRVDHAYSHFRITLHAYRAGLRSGTPRPRSATAIVWARTDELDRFAFPAANRRVLEAMTGR